MNSRRLTPELLDLLPHDDPGAIRSRRDLRRLNWLMGNYRWIASRIAEADLIDEWFELGSGDGHLANAIPRSARDNLRVTGVDFMPRPSGWPPTWQWEQGDLFQFLEQQQSQTEKGAGLIANLFLHHFETDDLQRIGALIGNQFSHLIINEPCRHRLHMLQSRLAYPFLGRVTRHDISASIEAGFRKEELADALGIDGEQWNFFETETFLGAYRFEAIRRS